jgi:hypothetical protein
LQRLPAPQLIQTPAVLNDLADRRIFPTHLVEQRDRQCTEYAAGQLAARGGTYPDWFELTKGRSVGYVADRIEVEISQPLLPIGMKTPMSMIACQHCDVPPAAGNMHAKSRNSAARPMP